MTGPKLSHPPPTGTVRRRWLTAVVVAWIAVLAGLAVWSFRHDPATVEEQRDIGQALPDLQRAVGVVFTAADGPGRAVALGDLVLDRGCRITAVRRGLTAIRDVTVYVRSGEARTAMEGIAAALPPGYRAQVVAIRGGTRLAMHADAGNFIAIESHGDTGTGVLTVRLSTGCHPPAGDGSRRTDPPADPPPAVLNAVLRALDADPVTPAAPAAPPAASASGVPTGPTRSPDASAGSGTGGVSGPTGAESSLIVRTVSCPDGGVAGTYTVSGIAAPSDLGRSLQSVVSGAHMVRSDADVWAYRTANDSVVVLASGKRLQVSVSTGC